METGSEEKTFTNYAAKRFCNNHTATATGKPLKKPLLSFSSYLDQEAARAVSFAVHHYIQDDREPVGLPPTRSLYRELIRGLQLGSTGEAFSPYPLVHGRKTSNLDKLHLIGGLGILGPQLRDEILCQICKQINGNHSAKFRQKGWTLLACCLSLFLPSDEFAPYLEHFINSGPEKERLFCMERLNRTRANGSRYEPLSSVEYDSIVKREMITRNVSLLNGKVVNCRLDSATTGLELRKQIKAVSGMVDLFGFSFIVDIGHKVNKIVGGSDHVMDVVSSCEQAARELSLKSDWSIVFFKEIFSPWQTPSVDPNATGLIYNQIITWVKSSKYKIIEEEILAKMAATQCYVLNGQNATMANIESSVVSVVPNNLIDQKNKKQKFVDATASSFDKKFRHVKVGRPAKYVDELVNYAKHKMTGEFTRYFELVQESTTIENTSLLSVNWNNIRVFQKQSLSAWTLAFPEIMKVSCEKLKDRRIGTISIYTIHGDKRKLASLKAEEIHQLLSFFLSGLRKRSTYLLALRDQPASEKSRGALQFVKGDLIKLKGSCDGESVQATGRGYGVSERTGSSGEFSGGLFYIIPTLQNPSEALLETLRNGVVSDVDQTKFNRSVKAPASIIRSGSNIIQRRPTSNSRKSSEMFLDLKEYENIRYPLNNPAAPNIHDILKPVTSRQENGLEEISKKPKAGMLLDLQNDDYLDLGGPPMRKYDDFFQSTSHTKYEKRMEHSHPGLLAHPDSKTSSTHSEGSVKVPYEEMVLTSTVTTTTKSSSTAVATVNVVHTTGDLSTSLERRTDHVSSDVVDALVPTEQPEASRSPTVFLDQEAAVSNIPERASGSLTESSSTSLVKNGDGAYKHRQSSSFKDTPCYKSIITYVFHPAGDITSEMKLSDDIFGKAISKTKYEDDVYLEIMTNIQAEEYETIVERSWELMWLATGLYPCSENIRDDVIGFLRARTDGNPLARQCYTRLVKMITHGRRMYPPHVAEVRAIQTRMDLINHKVFFPDGSCQSFEVESSTTARHLTSVITESIGLKYPTGCGLFFKIGEKVFGAADEYFFFDFIQHFIEVWRKDKKDPGIAVNYQVFFLRKVWINVVPGADRVADCRLHYYQELSKYLRGYHKCAKEDSVSLAALVFRAEFGEDTDNLSEIPDTLNKLVPQDVISEMTVDEWEQALGQALSKNSNCVGDDAKIEFLKELSKLPTFGSAFFHAKPKPPSDLPETLLIAIQTDGFALMTDVEKTIIEKYDFDKVIWWSSGEHIFRVDVEGQNEKKRLEFQTSLDYQIDDFLTSYISVYGSDNPAEGSISSDE